MNCLKGQTKQISLRCRAWASDSGRPRKVSAANKVSLESCCPSKQTEVGGAGRGRRKTQLLAGNMLESYIDLIIYLVTVVVLPWHSVHA